MNVVAIVAISVIFGGGFLAAFLTVFIKCVTEFWKHIFMLRLKTKMIENGYSAEDIERVLGIEVDEEKLKGHSVGKRKFNKPKPPVKS